MISVQLSNLKTFTTHLLLQNTFDSFSLEKASIVTAVEYSIDGRIHPGFYTGDDTPSQDDFISWGEVKTCCLQVIKGKRAPLSFKFILHAPTETTRSLLAKLENEVLATQIQSLVLTIVYDGTSARCTSGCSYKSFIMDKSADALWDDWMCKFLDDNSIPFNTL
ncbi:MAG: DUF5721 family protein [Lachnospiraceae bacterium]|jgi:hypothetical protein|nr:DUF5721 family protein [Lachnospiraceae bacterium]